MLNCCGRLNKPSIGIGVCLDNFELKQKANELLRQYKQELINGLNWFYSNKDKLIKKGLVQAKKFSWQKTAEQTLSVFTSEN